MSTHIRIERDTDPGDGPRDWDPPSVMACWHRSYTLGDVQPKCSPEDWIADNAPEGSVVLPLYLYDHSGLSMSTGAFACGWDSGQVGVIVCTPETIAKEWDGDKEAAERYMTGEVDTYDRFLRGDVWGFVVEQDADTCDTCSHTPEREHVDSCWGFYGPGELDAMKEHVDTDLHEALTKAWENR